MNLQTEKRKWDAVINVPDDEWIQKPEKIAANLSPRLKKDKRAASRDTAPTNIGGKGGEEVKSFKVHSVNEQSEL